jgi:hypothetical protein
MGLGGEAFMKKIDWDNTWIGAIIGLIFPFIVFNIYHQAKYSFMDMYKFIEYLNLGRIFPSVVTLCVLANLMVFYPFISKEKYLGARGVILSTLAWGAFIMFLKYYTNS